MMNFAFVNNILSFIGYFMLLTLSETVSEFSSEASGRTDFKKILPFHDEGVLSRDWHRETWASHFSHVWYKQGIYIIHLFCFTIMFLSTQDGHIDFREFMIVLYVMSNGSPEENLKQIFRVFDINNDGSISLKELQRIVKDLFHLINEQNADEASQEVLAQSGTTLQLEQISFVSLQFFYFLPENIRENQML